MSSTPTQGIGGEAARSESKQGGARGLGRALQGRAARSAEVRKCGTRRDHLPLLSQRCENTCKKKNNNDGLLIMIFQSVPQPAILTYCRCFGAPVRRVFPDHLITYMSRVGWGAVFTQHAFRGRSRVGAGVNSQPLLPGTPGGLWQRPLAACAPEGMAPNCHWEAHEPWQTSEGEPSQIKRIPEESPAAARGEEILIEGERAVTITYRVFQWGHIVGVLDAGADFDVQQQKGGRAWGFAALGCSFVETRNAFRRDGRDGGRDVAKTLDFDQLFTTSRGLVPSLRVKSRALVKKVEGFRISIHINWPERQLYFSIAGGAYCSNPHPGPHHNPGLGPDPNPNPNPNPNPRPNQMGPTVSRQSCCRLTCGACGLGYRLTASTPPLSCRASRSCRLALRRRL